MHQGHLVRQTTAHSQLNLPTVGWKGKLLFSLLSIHSLLYALCTHAPPTIYATLLCMHNQQTNRVFPSPRLGLVLHNSRQLGWNSGPPPQDSGVCMTCGYYLVTTHPLLSIRPNYPISVISCFIVYTGEERRRKVEQLYALLCVLFQQVASWHRPIVVVGEEAHCSSKFGLSQTMVGGRCPVKAQVSMSVSMAPPRYPCPGSSWHL